MLVMDKSYPTRPETKPMIGRHFGDWEVLSYAGRGYSAGQAKLLYLCRCVCGRTQTVLGAHLRRPDGPGASRRCLRCSRQRNADRARRRSIPVGDGRTCADIAEATGIPLDTIYHRFIRGWPPDRLSEPLHFPKRRRKQ